MKLKASLVVLLMALSVAAGHAQKWKGVGLAVKAGLNVSDLTSTNGNPRAGLHAGISGDWFISRNFGLELGLYYSQGGSNKNRPSVFESVQTDYHIDYLSIPFTLNYRVFNMFRAFAGPYMGVVLDSKQIAHTASGKVKSNLDTQNIDFGILVGVGFTFPFGLDITGSYSFGISDVIDNKKMPSLTSGNSHTSLYRVSVGYRFLKSVK